MITQLLPTELWAVEVPEDSFMIYIGEKGLRYDVPSGEINAPIVLPKYKFEFLGECIDDSMSFWVADYIEESRDFPEYKYGGELHPKEMYWDYVVKSYDFTSPEESFYSLLESNGLSWVNPKPHPADINITDLRKYSEIKSKWCEAQQKLIKGKLIILKKI